MKEECPSTHSISPRVFVGDGQIFGCSLKKGHTGKHQFKITWDDKK